MKKMKHLVAVLLAGIMALAVLTGCGQTNVDLSDKLAQKATEVYAKAFGVKAEKVQLTEGAAALNKAMLDAIGEDGVMVLNKGDKNIEDVSISADKRGMMILHKNESCENNRYRMVITAVFLSGERTEKGARILAPVAALKAEQVNAILSGSLDGLKIDSFGKPTNEEIKGVGVSAKKLKDGTYCYVLTIDMIS